MNNNKENQPQTPRETQNPWTPRETQNPRNPWETREIRDLRNTQNLRNTQETREPRDLRNTRNTQAPQSPHPKNIPLSRYSDGTPSVMRKSTVYKELHFFRKSDVLVQLTKAFCHRFLPHYGDRTVDQMIQAARSIKQNIAEGFTDGQTSFETEIKLLGIAKGSNQELLEDYQDYLKQHNLPEWAKTNIPRYDDMRTFCRDHSDEIHYRPYFDRWTDEEMVNVAICLCHMVDKAMTSFLAKRDREFVEEGGIRERMTAARLDMRATQKQIISQQEQEIATLKAQNNSLTAQINSQKAQINSLTAQINSQKTQINSLTAQISSLQHKLSLQDSQQNNE